MANKPKDRKPVAKAAIRKVANPKAATGRPAKPAGTKPVKLPPMHMLTAAYADAVASVKTLAEAHTAAFSDTYGMLTARANGCNKAPTRIEKVGGAYMICYLMEDCSYGNCQPYNGPTD